MTTIDQQQAAMLRAICQRPDDMQARLVYADWCEDNGLEARAEFIRVQIELSAWGPVEGVVLPYDAPEPFRRERELLKMCDRWWVPPELAKASGYQHGSWPFSQPRGEPWGFRNGFVESITTTTAAWLAHGPQIVAATPVRTVRLSDKQPWRLADPLQFCWISDRGAKLPHRVMYTIPHVLFEIMETRKPYLSVHYPSEHAALDALSAAAVVWARRQAGLDQEGVAR